MDRELIDKLQAERASVEDQDYRDWLSELEEAANGKPPCVNSGFVVDTEFQPLRWMRAGLELLKTGIPSYPRKLVHLEAADPTSSYLPYATFQMGSEIFLKGMWLCQFPECRSLAHTGFVDPETRARHRNELKELGHDLLKIVSKLSEVPKYAGDTESVRFLNHLKGIIHRYYFPVHSATSPDWASARYPKRFYRVDSRHGTADAVMEFPGNRLVFRLFNSVFKHIDGHLWKLTTGLMEKGMVGDLQSRTEP